MHKKFTLNHLFLYHYNELSLKDSLEIEHLIETDISFKKESKRISEMKQFLNSENKLPSSSSIKIILDYDKASSSELAY